MSWPRQADQMMRCCVLVAERLGERWSLEQVSQAMREQFPDEPERQLMPETISGGGFQSWS